MYFLCEAEEHRGDVYRLDSFLSDAGVTGLGWLLDAGMAMAMWLLGLKN